MKEIERQKEELKAKICEEIDKYYEEIGKRRRNKSLKIGEIERMLVEKKAELSAMLTESTGEAISELEAEKKVRRVRAANESTEARTGDKDKDDGRRSVNKADIYVLCGVRIWGMPIRRGNRNSEIAAQDNKRVDGRDSILWAKSRFVQRDERTNEASVRDRNKCRNDTRGDGDGGANSI